MTNKHPDASDFTRSDVQTVGLTRAEKTLTTKGEELIELVAELRLCAPVVEDEGFTACSDAIRQAADALQALIDKGNKELESAPPSVDGSGIYKALPSREEIAAAVWSSLWNSLGFGQVTPAMFVTSSGGPQGAAYLKAADAVLALPTLPVDVSGDRKK